MTKPYPTPIPDELAGSRALVTGGSRGIGAAIAQRLIDAGATVATTARTQTTDTPTASTFIPADLRTSHGAAQLVDSAVQALGGLDILVNNAGAARAYPAGSATIPDEEWTDALNINFLSAVRVTRAALQTLAASKDAVVINISSAAATDPMPPILHYAAAKAALLAYNAGLAKELAPNNIRVNAVLPGQVETAGGTELLQTIADAMGAPLEALSATIPLGRRGNPRDIAELVAFLASNRAQWITGESFAVDGGQ
jgi:NAD(P)-dependent dehydrogenase (short-subunit alcohol dehydrogenase family)